MVLYQFINLSTVSFDACHFDYTLIHDYTICDYYDYYDQSHVREQVFASDYIIKLVIPVSVIKNINILPGESKKSLSV